MYKTICAHFIIINTRCGRLLMFLFSVCCATDALILIHTCIHSESCAQAGVVQTMAYHPVPEIHALAFNGIFDYISLLMLRSSNESLCLCKNWNNKLTELTLSLCVRTMSIAGWDYFFFGVKHYIGRPVLSDQWLVFCLFLMGLLVYNGEL